MDKFLYMEKTSTLEVQRNFCADQAFFHILTISYA